jgi:hypothetical protein
MKEEYLNTNSIIPVFNVKEKQFLNNIYNIYNWNDALNYFKNYKNNDFSLGFERILMFSWIVFLDDYKNNLNQIFEIYKIYIKLKDIKLTENQLKEKIKNFDFKNNYSSNNIYKTILQ